MIRTISSAVVVGVLALVLGGCGDEEGPRPGGGAGGAGGGGGTAPTDLGPLEWEICDQDGIRKHCVTLAVPMDWTDPDGPKIPYFVQRIPSTARQSRGQLWILVGGPGYAGSSSLGIAPFFAAEGWDVYLPDYRGVGRSAALHCEDGGRRETSGECMDELIARWGDGLEHFSTSGAAMDLGNAIEAMRREGEPVMVFGSSYGTFVANRYLHFFPEQADGVIQGGICPATGCNLRIPLNTELAARRVFEKCGQDTFCSSVLGPNPWSTLQDTMDRLDQGHCYEFGGGSGRQLLGPIVSHLATDRATLPIAVAAVHRVARCEPHDLEALQQIVHLLWGHQGFNTVESVPYSSYLYFQVLFSEFWEEGLTPHAFREEAEALTLSGSNESLAFWKERWRLPLYETPASLKTWAPHDVPALMLNGTIDGQTASWDLADLPGAYQGPAQTYVELPFTGHGVSLSRCGLEMIEAFLHDPLAPVDTACTRGLEAVNFHGSRWLARQVMGREDVWEVMPALFAMTAEDEAEVSQLDELALQAALERARERIQRERSLR